MLVTCFTLVNRKLTFSVLKSTFCIVRSMNDKRLRYRPQKIYISLVRVSNIRFGTDPVVHQCSYFTSSITYTCTYIHGGRERDDNLPMSVLCKIRFHRCVVMYGSVDQARTSTWRKCQLLSGVTWAFVTGACYWEPGCSLGGCIHLSVPPVVKARRQCSL